MLHHLQNKRILIGITGGIAAYKILELLRLLKTHGAIVKVILTSAGKEFVTPLSIQALNGEKIYENLLDPENEAVMSHIDLARWAEVLLIAPATANIIAKLSYGIAEDLLTTVCLATNAPLLIAPAMNQQMWQNSTTQQNINTLIERDITILGPGNGSQACGEFGPGRMLEACELLNSLAIHFSPRIFSDKHLLITAGPTREALDPVRFLSNHSSGKMGYALAEAALKLGAKVTLISGPTNLSIKNNPALHLISIISAAEMHAAVLQQIHTNNIDIFIACAAVADYQPVQYEKSKIKKNADKITLELQRTPDILATVAKLPAAQRPVTIGFAAETENFIENATSKLHNKCVDVIIANSVANNKGFNSDENQVVILSKNSEPLELPTMRKEILAYKILENLINL